jgi:hypothetical protein
MYLCLSVMHLSFSFSFLAEDVKLSLSLKVSFFFTTACRSLLFILVVLKDVDMMMGSSGLVVAVAVDDDIASSLICQK